MRTLTAILDIDITRMFPDPGDLRGYHAAHALFRIHGRPVAWTTAVVDGGRLERDALIRALLEQHAWSCAVPLAERAILNGAPPRYLDVAGLLQVPPPRSPAGPRVTVAICNRAEARTLQTCLDAIDGSDYPNVDLLVIDGSADADRVEALVRDRARPVRYVRECEGRLLRRAVSECRGDVLAVTGGDTVPDARWVSAMVHVFLADPEVMAVTGPMLPRRPEAPLPEVARAHGVWRRWWRRQGDPRSALPLRPAANAAWWRPALESLEREGAGYRVVYEPSAIVWTPGTRNIAAPVDVRPARTAALQCAIDLASPLRPIDTRGHEALLLHVQWAGRPLGVARTSGGGMVSPLQVTDAVAQQLPAAVLDAGLGVGEAVCRAIVTADLARSVVARHGGSLQWMHRRPADSAVA